jgi:hypothetical protein
MTQFVTTTKLFEADSFRRTGTVSKMNEVSQSEAETYKNMFRCQHCQSLSPESCICLCYGTNVCVHCLYTRTTIVIIMEGVPYDVKPSAPIEAVVLEPEEVVDSDAMVESSSAVAAATPIWGLLYQQQPLMTVSTMTTVPELSLDVSGAKGINARNGVSGRNANGGGGYGQAGTDASTVMAGVNAGRVVLSMSTAAIAADSVIVKKGEYGGCILVQYTMSNTSSTTTSTDQSVFLAPQLQPETTGSGCPGTLLRSTIKILAMGGKGGDGGCGGNGSGGARGYPGQVSIGITNNTQNVGNTAS